MTRSSSTVLLLSADPMAAALLGMLAEIAGYVPAFPNPTEAPEEAITRIRPVFVVLLDGSLDAARSDLFFGQAARRRVGLAVLRPSDGDLALAHWARERDVPCFDVPTDAHQFTRVVDAAHASNWWRSGRDRRRVPQTERTSDGTLIYIDRHGHRWRVYDRRGTDRRQMQDGAASDGADGTTRADGSPSAVKAARPAMPDPGPDARGARAMDGMTTRIFVDDTGTAWWCPIAESAPAILAASTPAAPTPAASELERQLARATPLGRAP